MRTAVKLAALAAAGWAAFAVLRSRDRTAFGISEAAPLGEVKRLDPYLAYEEHLRKADGVPEGFDMARVPDAARAYTYEDAARATPPTPQRIVVLLRADGSVAAVCAVTSAPPLVTAVSRIMADYWTRVLGEKPSASGGRVERGRVQAAWTTGEGFSDILIRAR